MSDQDSDIRQSGGGPGGAESLGAAGSPGTPGSPDTPDTPGTPGSPGSPGSGAARLSLRALLRGTLGIVALGWLVVIVRWDDAPFALSFDDAYYYFTIARNWADGHASTFGLIDQTNGYHPLWQLVCIIPFAGGLEGSTAVRALLVTQLVAWLATWWLISSRIVEAVRGWPRLATNAKARRWCDVMVVAVAVGLAANPFVFKMIVNGLESGLVVPIGALVIATGLRIAGRFVARASAARRVALGALLALAVLARTDALLLVATIVVACVLERPRGPESIPSAARVRAIIQIVAIPAVVTATYLAINQAVFDTAMQISGSIKRLPLTGGRIALTAVWALVGVGVLLAARRPVPGTSKLPRLRRYFAATGWYATFCVGLVGYYATLQAVPYLWYFSPLALYASWAALLLTADLAEGGFAEAGVEAGTTRFPIGARLPALIVAVPLVVAVLFSIRNTTDEHAWSLLAHDARAGRWIDANLPEDAVVASWDAGAIGFYAHRPMVNLDGVVNTVEWSDATRQGTTAAFLKVRDVGWVANHGSIRDGVEPGIATLLRRYFGADAVVGYTTVYVDEYRFSGSLDGSRTDRSTKDMATFVYELPREADALIGASDP